MTQQNNKKNISKKYPEEVQKYLKEVGELPVLTIEEEKELAKKIEEGNDEAKRKLFYDNLDSVISIIDKYKNQNLTEFELICEGTLALIKAVNLFDWQKSYKFSTLAILLIREAILRSIKEGKTVFKGVVKAPPWPSFHDKSIYIDYFDEGSKRWVLEEMREFTEKEKEELQFQIKIDVKKNTAEIIKLLSKLAHISQSEAKKEIEKFLKEK